MIARFQHKALTLPISSELSFFSVPFSLSNMMLSLSAQPLRLMRLGFCLAAVFLHSAESLNATCFYPDGSEASTDTPCPSTGSSAPCCAQNSFCLSNGLCAGSLHYGRGSCTDPTWKAAQCPNLCTEGGKSFFSFLFSRHDYGLAWRPLLAAVVQQAVYIIRYPIMGMVFDEWKAMLRFCAENRSGGKGIGICSGGDLFSCDYQNCPTQNFSIPGSGNVQIVLRDYQLSSLGLQSSISTAPTATPTTSAALSADSTHTTPTTTPAVRSSNHNALVIGLGVGIPIGLAALAGLTAFILARRTINALTKGIQKSQADLLAYKEAQYRYEQQQSQTRYEAPFNGVKPELGSGRDYHQLHS